MPKLPPGQTCISRRRHIGVARQTPLYMAPSSENADVQPKQPGISELSLTVTISFETLAEPMRASLLSSKTKDSCVGNTCTSSSSTQHMPNVEQARSPAPSASQPDLMDILMSRPDRAKNFSVYSASRLSSNATCLDQTCTPQSDSQLPSSQSPILPSAAVPSSSTTHFAVAGGQAARSFSSSQHVDALDLATSHILPTAARPAPSQRHDSLVALKKEASVRSIASKKEASGRSLGGVIEPFKRIARSMRSIQPGDESCENLGLPCDPENDGTPRHETDDTLVEDEVCDNALFMTLADFESLEQLDSVVGKMPKLRKSRTPFSMLPLHCCSRINSTLMACFARSEIKQLQQVPEQQGHDGTALELNADDALPMNGRADRRRKIRILSGRRTRSGRRITV
eukprot:5799106-Pleurochrysis_carterae.AAC.1